jgi:hypothetical protein
MVSAKPSGPPDQEIQLLNEESACLKPQYFISTFVKKTPQVRPAAIARLGIRCAEGSLAEFLLKDTESASLR